MALGRGSMTVPSITIASSFDFGSVRLLVRPCTWGGPAAKAAGPTGARAEKAREPKREPSGGLYPAPTCLWRLSRSASHRVDDPLNPGENLFFGAQTIHHGEDPTSL